MLLSFHEISPDCEKKTCALCDNSSPNMGRRTHAETRPHLKVVVVSKIMQNESTQHAKQVPEVGMLDYETKTDGTRN